MSTMSRLQLGLAAILLAATAVFAAGAIAERSQPDTHAEPATAESHEEPAGAHRDGAWTQAASVDRRHRRRGRSGLAER